MRKYKLTWTLMYRDGRSVDGTTHFVETNEFAARARMEGRPEGVYNIKTLEDQGEALPLPKPFTVVIPSGK